MQKLPWLDVAYSLMGTQEIPGPKSNAKIISWAKSIGGWIQSFYKNDDIPWCGLFVGFCVQAAGLKPLPQMLSALAWNWYGKRLSEPYYGCILVFKRNGGGHVGFGIGQDKDTYHILGGNQSNSVNITRIAKSRCVGFRWPDSNIQPEIKLPYQDLKVSISTNER